ncbi:MULTISPECIES: mechanosensitive ion channel family protein [Shewanella]|uniref:Small-conductance mechanosensitive channel n=1 Tax=Shewanella vesiculosa TaxID=518738 RepID=A0ABV0FRM9_9GAMM|nr:MULTISPECIES: mechanosensitive ion channel family protein [Shewanella]NCQ45956.1 mechanosensitive ion channel family protein [Shewanella frigidimarina]MBB1323460.1 mechanosensitive ion channel family protein [Shewanella sp. SR43-8]MBB1390109.1 mechanosensitive ion channel family protein [Shewanella sp. SG44-6]NCO72031.1 mechanosensitive ion channel family protein [Shewanella vesiculosa]NCP36515.1 mechanosensitive ion channel family protein [Shewanella vesiculosa]|tara:strand:+ start:19944 stop:20906 length:963 start_codon:yes stop_codon:yes gene_type:complete
MDLSVLDKFWQLINEKLQGWLEAGIKHLPNFIVAFLLAMFFGLLAKYVGRVVRKVLHKALESEQIADLLSSIIKMLVLLTGLFIALEFLGLTGTVTSLLAGAGIIGLALGFAFQDMAENLIAGIAMGIRKPFQIGDVVEAGDVFGTVKTINLRNTLVETFFGQIEVIPNKILFRNVLTNYTVTGVRRIEVPVGISYADDPQKAAEAIEEAINACDFVIKKEQTAVFAKGFADSSINLVVWFWIDYPGDTGFMKARHTAVVEIKKALEKADILIPFPIRTLDFGAKGGEKLNTMLSETKSEETSEEKSADSQKSSSSENEK